MKIKYGLFVFILLINSGLLFSQVAINVEGINPDTDLKSNNKGLQPPRMTQAEMDGIPNPADGLIVYCTDCRQDGMGVLSIFMNGSWNSITVNCFVPKTPIKATNVPSAAGIVWDWKGVPYATGYKWNISNDYGTATQMDTVSTKTETGLACNTAYTRYVWAYNACGNSLPLALAQTTSACSIPTLTTLNASSIASTTAASGGNISDSGISAISVRGVCWGTAPNPTTANSLTIDSTGIGGYTSNLTGLTENTVYYLRAFAINSSGTAYGNEVTFRTLANISTTNFNSNVPYEKMTDIDGNVYKTIKIGTQTWMAENLRTTKYRNGDTIPNVTDGAAWGALATGAYCWYNNDAATHEADYGALYNWFAVADGRNIAPLGWHVPTDAEWATLSTYLRGEPIAGGKLKETGTSHWLTPNIGATNSSGFLALPGGSRYYYNGMFYNVGFYGDWWSSTAYGAANAWDRGLLYNNANINRNNYDKRYGFSVRCLRD